MNDSILTNTITTQTNVTIPEAALKIESNELFARYLFFHIVTDDTVNFQSNITDNWVENNTAIQDHIAISPVTITLKGLIGELVYTSEMAELDYEREIAQANAQNSKPLAIASFGNYLTIEDNTKLNAIRAYFPEVSNITQKAQSMWDLHEASRIKAQKIANLFTGQINNNLTNKMNNYNGLSTNARQSKLKEVTEYLKDCWIGRKSFTVNTPFGDFKDMYIQSVTLHQANENFIGDVDLTLKQLRFTETVTTQADEKVLAEYNAMAQAQSEEQNNGKAQGDNSQLYNMWGSGSAYSTWADKPKS